MPHNQGRTLPSTVYYTSQGEAPCGRYVAFKSEQAFDRWLSLHQKRCAVCKDFDRVNIEYQTNIMWDCKKA